jgi:hypothetical protein
VADSDIGLSGLYGYLQTAAPLFITLSQPRRSAFDNLAKFRLAIGTAHPPYHFACRIRRFQPEPEVFAKNTLYFRKLFFIKTSFFGHYLPLISIQQDSAIITTQQNKNKCKKFLQSVTIDV